MFLHRQAQHKYFLDTLHFDKLNANAFSILVSLCSWYTGILDILFFDSYFFGSSLSLSLQVALFVASPRSQTRCGLSTAIANSQLVCWLTCLFVVCSLFVFTLSLSTFAQDKLVEVLICSFVFCGFVF